MYIEVKVSYGGTYYMVSIFCMLWEIMFNKGNSETLKTSM